MGACYRSGRPGRGGIGGDRGDDRLTGHDREFRVRAALRHGDQCEGRAATTGLDEVSGEDRARSGGWLYRTPSTGPDWSRPRRARSPGGHAPGLFAASRQREFAHVDPELARLIGRPPTPLRAVLKAALTHAG